jgi:hypothetical protein
MGFHTEVKPEVFGASQAHFTFLPFALNLQIEIGLTLFGSLFSIKANH